MKLLPSGPSSGSKSAAGWFCGGVANPANTNKARRIWPDHKTELFAFILSLLASPRLQLWCACPGRSKGQNLLSPGFSIWIYLVLFRPGRIMEIMTHSILDNLRVAGDIPDQDRPVGVFLGILAEDFQDDSQ